MSNGILIKVTEVLLIISALGCSSVEKKNESLNYAGLGAESVSAEVVKQFAPATLPTELSRKIQNYLDVRSPGAGVLSADKKKMFFTWKVTGVNQVWRLDGPMQFPVQLTGGEDQTSIAGVDPKGRYILLQRDRAGEENPGLYLQNPNGGALTVIQHKPKVQTVAQFISEDGDWIYYRANDKTPESYAIYRYNFVTHKTELLFSDKGYWEIADFRGDGRLLLKKALTNVASEFYEWSAIGKPITPVIGQGEEVDYNASFANEEGGYIVLTNKTGEYRRLYKLKESKLTPISKELPYDVEGFVTDRKKKHLVYMTNEMGYTRLKSLNMKTMTEEKIPEFKDVDHVMVSGISRDGTTLVMSISASRKPKQSYTFDYTTKKLKQWLIPSTPEVNVSDFAVSESGFYEARDHTKIPYFMRRPVSCTGDKVCPVVIHFHGGPEGQTFPGFSVVAQLFVDAGFIFFEPNVRGSEGYGKTWLHIDDGPKRLNVITDIPDAADWIRKTWSKNGVTPKVGVMGWSYGGYSTQVAMTKYAGSYDAGVALVGMSNLSTFLKNTAPYRRALRIPEYGDPERDAAALKELSPITYVSQVKNPILFIQGVSDPRVPAGEAIQMYNAVKSRGIETGLILFADEGHGSQKRSNQVLEIGHTLQFFMKHLK